MNVTHGEWIGMYRRMLAIRRFEERVSELVRSGHVRASHLYIGEEAVAVGVCSALRADDSITSTHRGHGHLIAKGARFGPMMAELLGKRTGYCKGKGGSMHMADFSLNIFGALGIVGGGLPIATGAGLAAKLRGTDQVAVCFFGDGASNQGTFHESLNLAAVWKLPVLYVCENNLYGEWTPAADVTAVQNIADRAAGYGIPGVVVDGQDVLAVYEAATAAVARARAGAGPSLIECKTYRFGGHFAGDEAAVGMKRYRSPEELERWKRERDPVANCRAGLLATNALSAAEADAVDAEINEQIDEAVAFAISSPLPEPTEVLDDMYATPWPSQSYREKAHA